MEQSPFTRTVKWSNYRNEDLCKLYDSSHAKTYVHAVYMTQQGVDPRGGEDDRVSITTPNKFSSRENSLDLLLHSLHVHTAIEKRNFCIISILFKTL